MFVTEAEDFAENLVTTLQKTVEDIVLVHVRLVRGGNAPVQFPRWGVCNIARAYVSTGAYAVAMVLCAGGGFGGGLYFAKSTVA